MKDTTYTIIDIDGVEQNFDIAKMSDVRTQATQAQGVVVISMLGQHANNDKRFYGDYSAVKALGSIMSQNADIFVRTAPEASGVNTWARRKKDQPKDAPKAAPKPEEKAAPTDAQVYDTVTAKLAELFDVAVSGGTIHSRDFRRDFAAAITLSIATVATHIAQREINAAMQEDDTDPMLKFFSEQLGVPVESIHVMKMRGDDDIEQDDVRDILKRAAGGFATGMPIEERLRPGEKPHGYLVGHLTKGALACLQDVVSHYNDFNDAIRHRIELARQEDAKKLLEDGQFDAMSASQRDANESYWRKQADVFDRMYGQAKQALEVHAQVVPK